MDYTPERPELFGMILLNSETYVGVIDLKSPIPLIPGEGGGPPIPGIGGGGGPLMPPD